MKTLITLLFTAFSLGVYAQIVPIPDANFKNALTNSACVDIDGNGIGDVDADTNNDGEIQVGEALAVSRLEVNNMNITSLSGIEYFTNLQYLNCAYNMITFLNVQGLINLQDFSCYYNSLTSLNLQGLTNLQNLKCYYNQLTSLDVQGCTNLQDLNCFHNQLVSLNIQGCTNLQDLECRTNQLTSLNVQGLVNLQNLHCGENYLTDLNVQGLVNLQNLDCPTNQLTSLNVQGFINLQYLYCNENQLTNLNVQGCTNLKELHCYENQLTNLNVQGLTNLQYLSCHNNQLTDLYVQGLTHLSNLYCSYNQLTDLNVQGIGLMTLQCAHNQLTSLNLQGTNLQNLSCSYNLLTTLDVRGQKLITLDCNHNQLTSLYIKNGRLENILYFSYNPNLTYICCDAGQFTQVQTLANQYGLVNCAINSYCPSFYSNGIVYNIQGDVTFDSNNNGCDSLDIAYTNVAFKITDGLSPSTFISNNANHYSILVGTGTYSVTPLLQNTNYFNITPDTIQAVFPGTNDTLIQNYCVTAIGIHHDVEAIIIPTTPARPGFDASYRIIYKNKGNQVENGNLTFTYDDTRLDLVSSSLNPDYQGTDSLLWNYTNLMPLETRIINLVLNVNTPTETPPVNVGDILDFSVAIRGGQPEETPGDNNTGLRQTVVGSYDPNDKTCLEGNTIIPDMVGDYVHYLIRFENTGTYAAENVVVKDTIDISKFEISTLQIVNTSHPMWTRITEGNVVEFIFENIQLPFASGSNDGFVAFKIKTKSTLSLGMQLTNQASIYFDFNLPIVTNNAITTVAVHQPTVSIAQSNHVCNTASLSASWLGVGSTYLWSTGETTATISGTVSTVYTVTVSNGEGNIASASTEIAPWSITTLTTSSPTTCGLNNGTATTSAIGSYLWSNGETTQTISDLTPGNYEVTVTDIYGCTAAASVTVAPSSNPLTPPTINNNNGVLSTATGYTIQWFLNGTAITGASTNSITPTQNGDYTVQITDAQGCTAVSSVYTLTNVGVESVRSNSFLIFPNPVHDLLTFQSDATITKVEIYDTMGRLVQVSTLNDNRISVEKLSNGIYFLNVYTESGVMRGRVVKEL